MGLVLRSADLPTGDRVEFIRSAIWDGVLPVEIDWGHGAQDIDLVCRLAVAGPLNFSSARSSTNGLRRTSRLDQSRPRPAHLRRHSGFRHHPGRTGRQPG